jgi:hypothetical protein
MLQPQTGFKQYKMFQKELYNGIPNVAVSRVLRKRLHSKADKLSIVTYWLCVQSLRISHAYLFLVYYRLKMEAFYFSETSVNMYRTGRCYVPEHSTLESVKVVGKSRIRIT